MSFAREVIGLSSPQPSSSGKSNTAISPSHRPARSLLNLPGCTPKIDPPCLARVLLEPRFKKRMPFLSQEARSCQERRSEKKELYSFELYQSPSIFIMSTIWPRW